MQLPQVRMPTQGAWTHQQQLWLDVHWAFRRRTVLKSGFLKTALRGVSGISANPGS